MSQAARLLAQAEVRKDTSAHTDWMDECVPRLMGYGKDQDVAVAACLNMWRQAWEESHPGGEDDPGPSPPGVDGEPTDEKAYARARELAHKFDPSQPRDETGKWTDGGGDSGGKDHPGEGYSKHAYVKDGVIHTTNVYDAARALHEGRKVELDQPRGLSVLIDKLGEISKEMIDKGEKAPNFNLCNVTLRGTSLFCASSKGVPRVEMPQMTVPQTQEFIKHLQDSGYQISLEDQFASHLRATQNELNGAKVAGIANAMRSGTYAFDSRTIVSNDDYILDGHHRWAAKVGIDAADNVLANDTKIPVARVNISITKLLEEADKFTGGKGKRDIEDKRARWAKLKAEALALLAFDPSQPRDEEGKWTDTGASAGGGASSKPAKFGKIKPTREEFIKDDVMLPERVRDNPIETEKFLEAWEATIGMDPGDFKEQFLGGAKATMQVQWDRSLSGAPEESTMHFDGSLLDADGKVAGRYDRNIDFRSGVATSQYLLIKQGGHGHGKKILAGNVDIYEKLGIETVKTDANISTGGYAWAKYGYLPTDDSWSELQDTLRTEIEQAKEEGELVWTPSGKSLSEAIPMDEEQADELLALLDTDEPKALWAISDTEWGKALLAGTSWEGVLDLTDKETMQRFNDYTGRKKK